MNKAIKKKMLLKKLNYVFNEEKRLYKDLVRFSLNKRDLKRFKLFTKKGQKSRKQAPKFNFFRKKKKKPTRPPCSFNLVKESLGELSLSSQSRESQYRVHQSPLLKQKSTQANPEETKPCEDQNLNRSFLIAKKKTVTVEKSNTLNKNLDCLSSLSSESFNIYN